MDRTTSSVEIMSMQRGRDPTTSEQSEGSRSLESPSPKGDTLHFQQPPNEQQSNMPTVW